VTGGVTEEVNVIIQVGPSIRISRILCTDVFVTYESRVPILRAQPRC
jgi:hypothetical protein